MKLKLKNKIHPVGDNAVTIVWVCGVITHILSFEMSSLQNSSCHVYNATKWKNKREMLYYVTE